MTYTIGRVWLRKSLNLVLGYYNMTRKKTKKLKHYKYILVQIWRRIIFIKHIIRSPLCISSQHFSPYNLRKVTQLGNVYIITISNFFVMFILNWNLNDITCWQTNLVRSLKVKLNYDNKSKLTKLYSGNTYKNSG